MASKRKRRSRWPEMLTVYYQRIVNWIRYELRGSECSHDENLDLTHDFLLHVVPKESSFLKAGSPTTYLKTALRNYHPSESRKFKGEGRVFVESMDTFEGVRPAAIHGGGYTLQDLFVDIEGCPLLDRAQKEALLLYLRTGSYDIVASDQGIKPRSARKKIERTLKKFLLHLSQKGDRDLSRE